MGWNLVSICKIPRTNSLSEMTGKGPKFGTDEDAWGLDSGFSHRLKRPLDKLRQEAKCFPIVSSL